MRKFFLVIILLFSTVAFLKAQTVDVTFQVDMSVPLHTGAFNAGSDQVELRGSFDGWGAGIVLSDGNNDSVYIGTVAGQPQNTVISYKFFHTGNSGTWESDPNREINTGTAATLTIDPSFWNEKEPYTGIPAPIDFSVDMQLPAQGDFDPATDHVFIAGSFTNWGTGAIELFDSDNDSIYTVSVPADSFISGQLIFYKFLYSADTPGNGTWESPQEGDDIDQASGNRIYGVHDGTNDVSRWWNNVNPNVQLASGNIFFEVDMSVASELGVFDFNTDSVQIRGAFNDWGAGDPDKVLMSQDAGNPDHWTIEIPFVNQVLYGNQLYKFYMRRTPRYPEYANTGWEVPIEHANGSDRNRGEIFQGDPAQSAPYQWFENINPDWVIPTGTTVECTFRVDMTNATNPDSQAVPFVPGVDTVWWIPRQPLFYEINNILWDTTGFHPARFLELTDPDQDMVYEGSLTFDGPSYNGFLYNYAYSSGTPGTLEHEGLGATMLSQGDCRVRFVGQNGARTFQTPWTMPLDVWSNSAGPEEYAPQGWTSVKEIPGLAQTYSLDQNFPNPFNPSTKIRFNIPEQGMVSLKVFNLLGEEVANLVNAEMTAGNYEVDFKATGFSSGIYFYTLKAGNFISTKKMILLK